MHLQLVTILWSAKESIFKWYGNGEVDFRKHICLLRPPVFHVDKWTDLHFEFRKHQPVQLKVHARIFEGLVLAYVAS